MQRVSRRGRRGFYAEDAEVYVECFSGLCVRKICVKRFHAEGFTQRVMWRVLAVLANFFAVFA